MTVLTPPSMEAGSVWDDIEWTIGQLFMMGFDGTEVTPQVRQLIEKHHVGTILLTAKNLKSAAQTTELILDLQTIAHDAGHLVPLAVALDQENGGVNSLFDADYVRQFPSAMGVAATGSTDLVYEVAKATADELSAVGINWIMGPCLDVLTNIKSQPLGVRSIGDDPDEVSRYGIAAMNGYKDAGLVTCGKHFPSYGNLEFLGSSLDVPIITDSLEQLSLSALVPFRDAVSHGVDAMMVGGCAMSSAGVETMHACLSDQVVDGLLREDMQFDGVVVSECLEMEALSHNIGVAGGTVMAANAGCDLILVCRSPAGQHEAINGLKLGLENGMITQLRLKQSLSRILEMKAKFMTWERALNPGGVQRLSPLQLTHEELSQRAYNASIALVRDKERLLPLSNLLDEDEEVLLITPLVKPLPASAASKAMSFEGHLSEASLAQKGAMGMGSEQVFQEFGRALCRQRAGRVLHTSYTANGVRPLHEDLINRASAVIVVSADANRNLYQYAFAKHVAMICKLSQIGKRREKPLVVVSVSSPYDFAMDSSLGTYVCTFDFTETALQALVNVLVGDVTPTGTLPGSLRQNQKVHQSKQHWLVETWDQERDSAGLSTLIANIQTGTPVNQRSFISGCSPKTFHLNLATDSHLVVRNSSTQALYGFCSTHYFDSIGTGVIGVIIVDPERRNLSLGHSLHARAIKTLLQRPGIKRIQLGSRIPSVFLGIPSNSSLERRKMRQWFANMGWSSPLSTRTLCRLLLSDLQAWKGPDALFQSLRHADVDFDLVQGSDHETAILDFVKSSSRQGVREIYQLALADALGSAIIRVKRNNDGVVMGTVVLYTAKSNWADKIPAIQSDHQVMGGISSPVISPSAGDFSTLLQGLIMLGIRQHQKQHATAVILDCVDDDGNLESMSAMGFNVLHSFDEVSCDADIFRQSA